MLARFGWWLLEKLITVGVFYTLFFAAGALLKICGGKDSWTEILIGAGIGAVIAPVACSLEWTEKVIIVDDLRKK